jgi:hypothetical protein
VYPSGKQLQFWPGESKRRHPARRSVPDHISNLTFVAASQAAAVDQRGSPVTAFSALAVATFTALLKLFLAEFRTLRARNLAKSLDRSQSRRHSSKRDINRTLSHWSHHL